MKNQRLSGHAEVVRVKTVGRWRLALSLPFFFALAFFIVSVKRLLLNFSNHSLGMVTHANIVAA